MAESNPLIYASVDDGEVVVGAQAMEEHDVFVCNICMDPPTNSIVTKCGHIFCWSCLHQWLQNKKKPCPVYKVMVGSGDVTPIYECQRGSSSKSSNGLTPPRPHAPSECAQATQSGERVGATDVSIASNSRTPSEHGLIDATLEVFDAYQAHGASRDLQTFVAYVSSEDFQESIRNLQAYAASIVTTEGDGDQLLD